MEECLQFLLRPQIEERQELLYVKEEIRIRILELDRRMGEEREDEGIRHLSKIEDEEIEFVERLRKVNPECEEEWRKIMKEAEERQAEHEEKMRRFDLGERLVDGEEDRRILRELAWLRGGPGGPGALSGGGEDSPICQPLRKKARKEAGRKKKEARGKKCLPERCDESHLLPAVPVLQEPGDFACLVSVPGGPGALGGGGEDLPVCQPSERLLYCLPSDNPTVCLLP